MATLLNGLQTPELGEFEGDPNTDSLFEVTQKFKENSEILDKAVGTVNELDTNMDSLEAKGLVVGFVYGGSFNH